MRTMSATIQIDASPMDVWAILTDLGSYSDWNPLFRSAAGEVAPGKRITLRSVRPDNRRAMTVKPKIVAAEAGAELRWTSSLPGIMSGAHSFVLTSENGGTRVVQSETFRGLLVPFSGKTLDRAEHSFRELNEALKKRAEAGR